MFLVRLLIRLILLAVLALIVGVPLVLWLSIENAPLVLPGKSPDPVDAARVKHLLRHHDPRGLQDGETRTLRLSTRDLQLILNYASPFGERQRADALLVDHGATLRYTLALPSNPVGDYFNLSVEFSEEAGELFIEGLRAGQLTVPGLLLNPLVDLADKLLIERNSTYHELRQALHSVALQKGRLLLTYRWDEKLLSQIEQEGRELLLPEVDRLRMLAYYRKISVQSRGLVPGDSLAKLLAPLFSLAAERTRQARDAGNEVGAAENRALLLTLGLVVSGSNPARLLGEAAANERAPLPMYLTLGGRGDLAKHFAISAALAVGGGQQLADAVGVFKELDDSRGGSGFSFPDLLADRAGVELASQASGERARRLQTRMALASQESDFMPPVSKLPEGLMEMEFKSRYRDLDDRAYGQVKAELERRIAACRVYRG